MISEFNKYPYSYNKHIYIPCSQYSNRSQSSPLETKSVVHEPIIFTRLRCNSRFDNIFISDSNAVRCDLSNGSIAVFMATFVVELG